MAEASGGRRAPDRPQATDRPRRFRRLRRWWLSAAVAIVIVATAAPTHSHAETERVEPRAAATDALAAADRTRLALQRETPPARDEAALARQLRGRCTDPLPTPVPMAPAAVMGETRSFNVLDERRHVYVTAPATLLGASEHLLLYVQDGVDVAPESVTATIDAFERHTLPILEATFGPMPQPGRITVFHGHVPGVGGYFSSSDLVPASLSPHSNERIIIYINSDVLRPGTSTYNGVLSHEAQHVLHWFRHPQQDSWLNEGASEFAMVLTGDPQVATVQAYLRDLRTPITGWAEHPAQAVPHYGGASLITRYLAYRTGGPAHLREIIETPGVSTQGVDRYLASTAARTQTGLPARPMSFDALFSDFIAAVVLDDPSLADGRFAFGAEPTLSNRAAPTKRTAVTALGEAGAATTSGSLAPYGADVIEVRLGDRLATASLRLDLDAAATTAAIETDPPDGGAFWWAYPADEVAATLTRTIDLTGTSCGESTARSACQDGRAATLEFDAYYDLETDFDYAGVALSTDDGCTWRTVEGTATTARNPVGQNPGHALTGASGRATDDATPEQARWVPLRFDLTAAAGSRALVRIFQVTDQSFHRSGLAVTHLRVSTSTGTMPDTDTGTSCGESTARSACQDWDARGFIRTENRVAIDWAARAIFTGPGGTRVETIPLLRSTDSRLSGTLVTTDVGVREIDRATILIAPMVAGAQTQSGYRLTATALPVVGE